MPPVRGEHIEELTGQARHVDQLEAGDDGGAEESADPFVVEYADRVAHRRSGVRREGLRVERVGEPCGEASCRIEMRQLGEHLLGAEKIRADEGREVLADPILVARDDRRVRDRESERVPEQRHHREPVGDRPHHRGLRECGHIAPGRMEWKQLRRRDIDKTGRNEQAERDGLHAGEVARGHPRPCGHCPRPLSPPISMRVVCIALYLDDVAQLGDAHVDCPTRARSLRMGETLVVACDGRSRNWAQARMALTRFSNRSPRQ